MPSLSSLLPLSLLASLVLGTPISAPPERSIALHNGFLRSYGFAEADAEAGPSGTLVTPVGSTTYYNAGGTGEVEVEYQGVTDGDSNDQSGRTLGINLVLVPRNVGSLDDRTNVTVATGLRQRVSGSSDPIRGWFVVPYSVCGDYRLYVYEKQLYHGGVITFQSAAPAVSFICAPIQ